MNISPNNNRHKPTEDYCELCGFMKQNFGEDEEYTYRISRELPGIAEGGVSRTYNPTSRQQEPGRYEYESRSLNIEDLGPGWIKQEIKRLLPETRNPGKVAC